MCGDSASTNRTRCRSVSVPMGDRPPISAYFSATGIERRDEINFAIGRRKMPSGPNGIMSGSRNRLSRNGSTASSESGPPSWNNTIPTRFFPTELFSLAQQRLEPFDLFAQRAHALRNGDVVHKKNRPACEVRREHAIQVFHRTSASLRKSSTLARSASSLYRALKSKISKPVSAPHISRYETRIRGSSPEPGPPRITGCGCCVRHQRIEKYTSGTSRKAKIPNSALNSARLSGSSIIERSNKYD